METANDVLRLVLFFLFCMASYVFLVFSSIGSYSSWGREDEWFDIIRSYWQSSVVNQQLRPDLGETLPFALLQVKVPYTEPRSRDAVCADFLLVHGSEVNRDAGPKYRRSRLKIGPVHPAVIDSARAFDHVTIGVGLRGQFARDWYWVAAVLPEGSDPLFNENGIGINSDVLAKPYFADHRAWTNSQEKREWAGRVELRAITHCDGFDIYNAEYKRY